MARKSVYSTNLIKIIKLHFLLAGLEKIRVLVRGNIFWYFRPFRPDLQLDLSADPNLEGDEETHLQPAPGNPYSV